MSDRSPSSDRHPDDDITAEFWGDAPTWRPSGSVPRIRAGGAGRAGRAGRADRARTATGRTRSHGIVGPDTTSPADLAVERSPAPPSWIDLDHADAFELELELDLDRRVRLDDVDDLDTTLDDLVVDPAARRYDRHSGRRDDRHRDDRQRDTRAIAAVAPTHAAAHDGRSARDDRDDSGASGPVASPVRDLADRLGMGSVDPLLLRLGAIVLIGVLLVPVALLLRVDPDDEVRIGSNLAATAAGRMPASAERAIPATLPSAPTDPTGSTDSTGSTELTGSNDQVGGTAAQAPVVEALAPACAMTYTVGAGDYWLRIAEESGAGLDAVLNANGATTDTAIHPGDDVCLPPGAAMPSPPPAPTTTPATTTPATTVPSAAAASGSGSSGSSGSSSSSGSRGSTTPTTRAPATTQAPATTAPPPPAPPTTSAPRPVASAESPSQVIAIIRDVWPEELQERAITVARRESSLRPGAYNGHCCYGVFQIYWTSHRGWLANHGVTSSAQLLDARTNVKMAYEIYRRAGGWGPWSQTAY